MARVWTAIDVRWRVALLAAVVIIVLPVAWYLGSPLFINRTVDESFPLTSPLPTTQVAQAPAPTTAAPAAPTKPVVQGQAGSQPRQGQPVALSTGAFGTIDAIHTGEGRATIYTLPDGQRVLRLEDFKVTNGPDLFVYLSGHAAPRSSAQVHEGPGLELGRLKGNIGNQNYELPADLDLSTVKSVVIYCKQFAVVFSTATLAPSA